MTSPPSLGLPLLTPFATARFARTIEPVAVDTDLEPKAHRHMLRRARGYSGSATPMTAHRSPIG
jgi:hypothetical protein